MIYTIRTTSGREDIVIDLLTSKVKGDDIDVKSVFHPAEIKGYVFIEGTLGSVHKAMQGLMHSRGLISKPIRLEEIQHFLEYKKARLKVDDGDIVEIIGGPFKGEKGRIIRINKIKDEITAELLDASIPIPVTIATEFVKIVKKMKPTMEETPEKPKEEESGKSVFDDVDEEKPAEKAEEKGKATDLMAEEKKEMAKAADAGEGKPAEKADEKPKKKKSFLEELEEEQGG